MNIFKKIKETGLVPKKDETEAIVVPVPDIKEYLVREYERVNDLKLINEGLEQQLELARETEMKYKATLVTLDEYSKRLKYAESEIERVKGNVKLKTEEVRKAKDELYSYQIKFNDAALTKQEIEIEIVDEVKADLISRINGIKGNLSKKIVYDVINSYKKR